MFIFDATPLIYLAKANKLEELKQLEPKKIIPQKVYQEVVEKGKQKEKPDAEKIEKAVENDVFIIESFSGDISSENKSLTEADLEVIKIAEEKDATAVMDEEHGRNIAEAKGVRTKGTAYLVLKMQKKEIIKKEESEETIDKMIDEGWYCSTSLYKDIMKKIEILN